MKAVSNRACTKISGCPAYSCEAENCLGKKIKSHKEPVVAGGVSELHNHAWYHQKRWRTIRVAHLSLQPLCQRCKSFGVITAGAHVDHVIAHQGDPVLFFDKSNLQTLCLSCHTTKTRAEQTGTILDYR